MSYEIGVDKGARGRAARDTTGPGATSTVAINAARSASVEGQLAAADNGEL